MNELKTATPQEKAKENLRHLKLKAEAILADRKNINDRWIAGVNSGPRGYDSSSLTVWRNAILETEKDLAKVSHHIQMINELFPTIK